MTDTPKPRNKHAAVLRHRVGSAGVGIAANTRSKVTPFLLIRNDRKKAKLLLSQTQE